ncbi:hypothetical protein EON63_22695, partial [archaeon]
MFISLHYPSYPGDKEETAINIAVACNLLLPKEYMDHIIINPASAPTLEDMKQLMLDEINKREVCVWYGCGRMDVLWWLYITRIIRVTLHAHIYYTHSIT